MRRFTQSITTTTSFTAKKYTFIHLSGCPVNTPNRWHWKVKCKAIKSTNYTTSKAPKSGLGILIAMHTCTFRRPYSYVIYRAACCSGSLRSDGCIHYTTSIWNMHTKAPYLVLNGENSMGAYTTQQAYETCIQKPLLLKNCIQSPPYLVLNGEN